MLEQCQSQSTDLIRKVGVDEEVANFTAPLGTTIGMAGCTCVWPILLAMFYLNATGQSWGVSQYLVMCFMCLVLSIGRLPECRESELSQQYLCSAQ